MWIRSQDKTELINANRIQAENYRIYTFPTSDSVSWVELGNYDTKERAIEVLNEIQDQLVKQNNTTFGMIVFEMPEK